MPYLRFQHPLDSMLKYREQLEEAGFVEIVEYSYKWPINRWPKDPKYKEIGLWAYANFSGGGIETFSLAIMTRPKEEGGLDWSKIEMEVFLTDVRKDMQNTVLHGYYPISVFHAKKPQ